MNGLLIRTCDNGAELEGGRGSSLEESDGDSASLSSWLPDDIK